MNESCNTPTTKVFVSRLAKTCHQSAQEYIFMNVYITDKS
jgi:hypothetical protein